MMKSLESTVELLPTALRKTKQITKLGSIVISGASGSEALSFTQGDVLESGDNAPLILYPTTVIGTKSIELTITYNTGSTLDITIPANTDQHIIIPTSVLAYTITNIAYKTSTTYKGTAKDEVSFFSLSGNTAKILYVHAYTLSDIQSTVYEMLQSLVLSNASGDWIDKKAASVGLVRKTFLINVNNQNVSISETDAQLVERIATATTPTDGTIRSVIEVVRAHLGLSASDTITVTEVYDQDGWSIGVSQLLANNQSELVLTGDVSIVAMQFIMTISGYTGSLTESDIEEFLRSIINVSASPIVRLS